MEGYLYKRREFVGIWERIFLKIDRNNGFLSYRLKQNKTSLKIKDTNEVRTRFSSINDE